MKRPLSLRYDPKAEDGDGDGLVQDSTPWERPFFVGPAAGISLPTSTQVVSGSRSTTASPSLVDFALPVQIGDKSIVNYADISNSEIPPFVKALIDMYASAGTRDIDRPTLNGLELVELNGVAIFPQYSLVSGIQINGSRKKKSSALVSLIPFGQNQSVSVFALHIPDRIAKSIARIGAKPLSVDERLRRQTSRSVGQSDGPLAFQHLDVPGMKTRFDNIAAQLLSRNIPDHARPLMVSFIDDLHRNVDDAAMALPMAKSISIWDNPNAKQVHTRLHVLSHEIGHLLDVVPSGYGSLGHNWRQTLGQDELPSRFSLSSAYLRAMVEDFTLNQSRRLDGTDIEQYLLNRITPEMNRVTDYATSYDNQNLGRQEDFAESFGLFMMSEILGILGNKKTGRREEYTFGSLFPNRDAFFRDVLNSFGISDIRSISGSKSTTRPKLLPPRTNIKSPNFPEVRYGAWSSSAPVIGKGRILPARFIDDKTSADALEAMKLLRKNPSMQGVAARWMLGTLTDIGRSSDGNDYADYFNALDNILDIAPSINMGTLFRSIDPLSPFQVTDTLQRGQTIIFRASPASFSPNDAFEQADRLSQSFGTLGRRGSQERILFAIPKTARGVIYDDSRVDADRWEKSPTEAIVRGRFSIASVKKRDDITVVELSQIDEIQNSNSTFMYSSTDSKIKPGSLIEFNNKLNSVGFSPINVGGQAQTNLDPLPGGPTQVSGRYLFEVEPEQSIELSSQISKRTPTKPSSASRVVASYEITDFGDALSFGERISPVGSKSTTKYAINRKFLDDDVFFEESAKNRERMFSVFSELGLDYDVVKQFVRGVILSRRDEIGQRSFKKEIREAASWYPRTRKGLVSLTRQLNSLPEMAGRRKFANEEIFAMMAALSPLERVASNAKKVNVIASTIARDAEFQVTMPSGGISGLPTNISQWLTSTNGKIFTPSGFINAFVEQFGPDSRGNAMAALARVHPDLFASKGPAGISNVIKALMIGYRIDSIDNILSGLKVRSFYLNFVNPSGNNVTIDSWMYRVMVPPTSVFTVKIKGVTHVGTLRELQTKLGKDFSAQSLFQSNKIDNITVGTYPIFAQIVRDLAREFSNEFPEFGTITPAVMQAFLWEIGRSTWSSEPPTQWDRVEQWFKL